ncbi:MAG: sulfite reductase subunit gamma [Hydrogenophilales bacterium CG03_land_8_20_14_0_80_62_28]|nr:TusE/DsrC/DsvC family sulfur relay protein [Betaproteobacteria bacterium]OIO76929.1 MAG: sulfite reductase subunit gamma [Hydrogenophilaceae bacterium CG1_02_62_390]PIV21568.1 MAG: sulfite reductase subunit gamma [Hydrogenophilales bacterium CG03_land_8_20_14_0_80_62_28]PIW39691.1 MAG: sulfite reductase subunit gamma [Hydrogenophilales bacterium CG15_BIG_FIL_POST_REV_8_21_14_020_62_31]PIW72022.1 MAG: sulfite reductase subunit gamma [Hydrogenophilales bacterium CG12_big_fil_rev_8_21_14_0_65_6
MGYVLNGEELEVDDEDFLTEANFSDEIVPIIAEAEGLKLTEDHWKVVRFMRQKYQEDGHTPNFRNMFMGMDEEYPGTDWKKTLYELFPKQPNRQASKVAGLPKPYGKGGY